MPVLNNEVYVALTHPDLNYRDPAARKAAFDALIAAGDDIAVFRQAMIAHKDFWKGVNGLDLDAVANDDAFLNPAVPLGGFLTGVGGGRVLPKLHVRAQLIFLGFESADEALLTKVILNFSTLTPAEKSGLGIPDPIPAPMDQPWIIQRAKEALLLQKLRACNDFDLIRAVLNAGAATFRGLIEDARIGFQPAILDARDDLLPGCRHPIYRMLFEKMRLLPGWLPTARNVLESPNFRTSLAGWNPHGPHNIFPYAADPGDVARGIPPVLTGSDEIHARQQMAIRYLQDVDLSEAVLRQMAGSVTEVDFRDAMAGVLGDPTGTIVTPITLPILRENAAMRALQVAIAGCTDEAALQVLYDAGDVENLRTVLNDHPVLGFDGPGWENFRQALRSGTVLARVKTMVRQPLALAKIRGADASTPAGETLLKGCLNAPDLRALAGVCLMDPDEPDGLVLADAKQAALDRYVVSKLEQASVVELATLAGIPDAAVPHDYANKLMPIVFPGAAAAMAPVIQGLCGGAAVVLAARRHAVEQYLWRQSTIPDAALTRIHDADAGVKRTGLRAAFDPANLGTDPEVDGLFVGTRFEDIARARLVMRRAESLTDADLLNLVNNLQATVVDDTNALNRLPDARKQEVRYHGIDVFLRRQAHSRELEILANPASTLDGCKTALQTLGINAAVAGAITADDQNRFRAIARERLSHLRVDAVSHIGAASRPALFALLDKLPETDRHTLLDNPKKLRDLLHARTADEVTDMHAGFTGHVPEITAFLDENRRLEGFFGLVNSEVAKRLAMVQPPLTLTAAQRDVLNGVLAGAAPAADAAAMDVHVNALRVASGSALPVEAFRKAFGLDDVGVAYLHGGVDIANSIIAQRGYNNAAINTFNTLPPATPNSDKSFIRFFIGLPKTANLDHAGLWAVPPAVSLLKAFQDARTLGAFHTAVEAQPWKAALPAGWKEALSPARFQQMKTLQRQEKFAAAGAAFNAERDAIVGNIRTWHGRNQTFMAPQNTRDLDMLHRVMPAFWFNPVFHAGARRLAKEMQPHFEKLDKQCKEIITNLEHQRDEMEATLGSIPVLPPLAARNLHQRALAALKQNVETHLGEVNQSLTRYRDIQKVLTGDPHSTEPMLQRGVLPQIQDVIGGARSTMVFVGTTHQDHPATTKISDLMAQRPGSSPSVTLSAVRGAYGAVGRDIGLDADKIREYTLNTFSTPLLEGRFVEQRETTTASAIPTGEKVEHVTITVTRFPGDKVPPAAPGAPPLPAYTPASEAESEEAKVKFALSVARQMLASIDYTPSKIRPLYLSGSDAEKMRYVWKALCVLGEECMPGKQFDASAIHVEGPFKPSKEQGAFSDFYRTNRSFDNATKASDIRQHRQMQSLQETTGTKPGERSQLKKKLGEVTGRLDAQVTAAETENKANRP